MTDYSDFNYTEPFPLGEDKTTYRKLTSEHVSGADFEGTAVLKVAPQALEELSRQALSDVNYFYRTRHLEALAHILEDPEASDNDRYVAFTLLKNAVISSGRVLPSCQDTGTTIVMGKKGQRVWTDFDDEQAISRGVFKTYADENLRYSMMAPLTMYEETNTGSNLPAQIDIAAVPGDAYKLLYIAKGGGSANKMLFFQETKAILNPVGIEKWLKRTLSSLGTAACPPYHLALVIGGTSAEATMKTLKLATAGYLDNLPNQGNKGGSAFRDLELEQLVLKLAQRTGIGAQFGGKYFAHDARVIRLPRHGASLPVGLGVSCSADRNILGKITAEGVFLEQLDEDPARFLPEPHTVQPGESVHVDLNRPMDEIRATLGAHPVKTRVMLSGKLIVARDIAHAKLNERVENGEGLPQYFKDHAVYYAGPAKQPKGMPSGSFGPTTGARMDPYVDSFQKLGGSMVMLAKGNRSQAVTDACKANGGFYLGSIGGPAAQLAHECITEVKLKEYEELGMEAIWEITVKDFPAFIVVDDKGNDFFAELR
ncbi:MAG: fumarate hydratase [SAR324 cluster bacterium]|nr:fumarate hydratase [SAR324 cluster bacterium]